MMAAHAEGAAPDAVRRWCAENNLAPYADGFVSEGYDTLAALCEIEEDDLEHCGVRKRAHKKRAQKALAELVVKLAARSAPPGTDEGQSFSGRGTPSSPAAPSLPLASAPLPSSGGRGGESKAPPPVCNAPGHWDVFIGHSRRSADAVVLASETATALERRGLSVWLDVRMSDRSTRAMEEGVKNSRRFVAVVTGPCVNSDRPADPPESNAYFRREYCIKELQWATEAGVPIQPIVRGEDKSRVGEFLGQLEAPLKVDGTLQDIRCFQVLGETDWIDLHRSDKAYWAVGIGEKLVPALAWTARTRWFSS